MLHPHSQAPSRTGSLFPTLARLPSPLRALRALRALRLPAAALLLSVSVGCPGAGGAKSGTGGSSHPLLRKVAPDIELKVSGKSWHPSSGGGKVVVLDYWATWCQPCKAAFPKVDAIYRRHKVDGLLVVAVNEDEEASDATNKKIDAFVKETGVTFEIARDQGGSAASRYGVETMPTQFVIDRRGVVRFVHAGYHPDEADALETEVAELLKEPL